MFLICKLPKEFWEVSGAENVSCFSVSLQQTLAFSSPKPCSYPDIYTNLFLPFLTKATGIQGSGVIHKKQTRGEVLVLHFCSFCCDWGTFCGLPSCLDGWVCHLLATACLDVQVLHHANCWCTEIPAFVCRSSSNTASVMWSCLLQSSAFDFSKETPADAKTLPCFTLIFKKEADIDF